MDGGRRALHISIIALTAAAALAGDDESPRLRFDWPVPTRVGVAEVDDDSLHLHYVVALLRREDGTTRVNYDDLRITEIHGRSADDPQIAAQFGALQQAMSCAWPDVVLDSDGRALDAPDALPRLAAFADQLSKSGDADTAGVAARMRKIVDAVRADPARAADMRKVAMLGWRLSVGVWVGLPKRDGTIFDGEMEFASAFGAVSASTMKTTVRSAVADGRRTLTLSATSDGDAAKVALARGEFAAAVEAKRNLDVVVEFDADSLRPRRATARETLEARREGDADPLRFKKSRVMEFEWDTPKPPTATSPEVVAAVDAAASSWMEASRLGDAETMRRLARPSKVARADDAKSGKWPETSSWTPFRRRVDGDWALVAIRLKRDDVGEQVWPLLLLREDGAWRLVGEGFAPAETGLVTQGVTPTAPRWLEAQLEDWTIEAMTTDAAAELVVGAPPRTLELAAGRGRICWFRLTSLRTLEIRAVSGDGAGPHVRLIDPSGVWHPTRSGTNGVHVVTRELPPGTYGVAVGVDRPGRVAVSVAEAHPVELQLGVPTGPFVVATGAPQRFRVRLSSPRHVLVRLVPVSGPRIDAELVLNAQTPNTDQSHRSGIVDCPHTEDVLVVADSLRGGDAECFVLAEDADVQPESPMHVGESRDVDVPAGGAVLVRIEAARGDHWYFGWTEDADAKTAAGEFEDERGGGGVIVASRGAATRVRVNLTPTK